MTTCETFCFLLMSLALIACAEKESDPREPLVVGARPTTVQMPMSEPLKRVIEEVIRAGPKNRPPLRLEIDRLEVPEDASVVVYVYLNSPEASLETSSDSSHFIGSISFFGVAAGGTQRFLLDLGAPVLRLGMEKVIRGDRPLQITFVLHPTRPGSDLGEGELDLDRLLISTGEDLVLTSSEPSKEGSPPQ